MRHVSFANIRQNRKAFMAWSFGCLFALAFLYHVRLDWNTLDATAPGPVPRETYAQTAAQFLRETQKLIDATQHADRAGAEEFTRFTFESHSRKTNSSARTTFFMNKACRAYDGRRLRVLVVCGMHAREMFTSDLCRAWMLYAAISAETRDPETCTDDSGREAAPFDWMFAPVANEGGRDLVSAAFGGNASDWRACHRGNVRGVDLNRNWKTYDRDRIAHPLENRTHTGREDPGPEAFSEPETLNLRDAARWFRPDLVLSIHSGAVAILTPYDDQLQPPDNYGDAIQLANWMAQASRCRLAKGGCIVGSGARSLYVSRGTMGDYLFRQNIAGMAYTLEVFRGRDPRSRDESWDGQPRVCFDFFNPPPEQLAASLSRWHGLWRELFYMKQEDRAVFERILRRDRQQK